MSLIDKKLSQYLSSMDDQAIAGFIREVAFALPEDQRRELIIKHLPEMKNECSNCSFDMGQNFEHCGASEDGTCPECGHSDAAEDVHPEPVEFNIEVCRTGWGSRTITVMACSQSEAEEKALDAAGDHEFSERDADYTIV